MSRTRPFAPPVTRADYLEMREGPPYYQLIEGDLVMSPSPRTSHQEIAGTIHALIYNHLQSNPIGRVFIAPLDVFLDDVNIYQPDVLFVSTERRDRITERGIEGAPDLLVEILSPSTAKYDKSAKRKVYARTGVQELWLVDPESRQIQVFLFAEDADHPAVTYEDDATLTSSLLPDLELKLSILFPS